MKALQNLIPPVYGFFSSGKNSFLFILFSIACRTINILFVSETDRDTIMLGAQSRNLLDGHGLSITKYYSAALDTPVYDYTPYWPSGFPVLLAPFLKLFNYDIYWAVTAVHLISCIAIILLIRKLGRYLKFPLAATNILTVIGGCFNYEFITVSYPTDTSAFTFFLLGICLLLNTIQSQKFQSPKLLSSAILLFLPCTIRYSYPPLSIAAFGVIIFIGWYLKKNILIKKGLVGLSVLFLLLAGFYLLLKTNTGSAGYIVETGRGFFPDQLLDWAPVGPGAFINIFFVTSQLIHITGISVDGALMLLKILNAIILVSVVLIFAYLFWIKKFFATVDPFRLFALIGFSISAATCISLSYLNLTYKPQPGWGNYLGEPRYFAFVTLFLQIIFIGWISLFTSWRKSIFQKIIVFVFSFILFIEVTHSIYFNCKLVMNFEKYKTAYTKEPDFLYFKNMFSQLIKDNPGTEILTIGDEFFEYMTAYLGQKAVYDGPEFIKSIHNVKKKTIVVFALYDREMPVYKDFLSVHDATFINKVLGVNFYRVDLLPGEQ